MIIKLFYLHIDNNQVGIKTLMSMQIKVIFNMLVVKDLQITSELINYTRLTKRSYSSDIKPL